MGANPWHLDAETESILFLTNMADQPCRIGFCVDALGTPYFLTDLSLKPHETRAIDLRKLRDQQKPDFRGNRIPAHATDGKVQWIRLEDVRVMGRLVVMRRQRGLASSYRGVASSYQCCVCGGCTTPSFTNVSVSPTASNFVPGSTGQCGATAQYTDCNNNKTYSTVTSSASWSSSNTGVATVNNGTSKGLVTGVAGGTANITATYSGTTYCWYTTYCGGSPTSLSGSGQCNVVTVDPISGPNAVPLRNAGSSGPNSINLSTTGHPSGGTYSWTTTSSNVTLTNATSSQVTVTSSAASGTVGDTPITVTYTFGSQHPSQTGSITVQKPTYLVIYGSDSTTAEASCTTGGGLSGCGVTRTFTYRVLDQVGGGSPINSSMPFWDAIVTTSPNNLNLGSYKTTCTGLMPGDPNNGTNNGPCGVNTNSDGTFNEQLSVCAPACQSSGTCITAGSTGASQTWNVNGFSLTLDIKSLSYQCNRVTVNGG